MPKKVITERTVTVVLGSKHKTEIVLNLIKPWVKYNPKGKIIVYDPRNIIVKESIKQPAFEIRHDPEFRWVDNLINDKICDGNGTLLIINAADFMFPKPKNVTIPGMDFKNGRPAMHKKFLDLLSRRRHLNIDMVLAFSKPDAAPLVLDHYMHNFIVLPIEEAYYIDKKSSIYQILDSATKSINIYSGMYGENSMKEFLKVDVQKNTITCSPAIDKEKFKKVVDRFKELQRNVEFV